MIATEALHYRWWVETKRPTEEQLLELYRLAQLAKANVILDEVGTNIALWWKEQGRYRESGVLWEKLVEVRKQQWGDVHPHVASSLNNLALIYESQGRYEKAELLFIRR